MNNQPNGTHLAQLNIATAVDDLDSQRLSDFVGAIDSINAVADRSPGFVWRPTDDSGEATGIEALDDPRSIVNLTVWETLEHLEHFVWKTVHSRVYAKRAKWFEADGEARFVMWWIPAGHVPNAVEGFERLIDLRANGPSVNAFGWESLPTGSA